VRSGLVERAADWPWSSLHVHLSHVAEDAPQRIVECVDGSRKGTIGAPPCLCWYFRWYEIFLMTIW
jgi:hypothetical protein